MKKDMTFMKLFVLIVFLWVEVFSTFSIPSFEWLPPSEQPDNNWINKVGARSYPEGKTYLVNAPGDGKTLCTQQIQATIDKCAAEGGGQVYFADGCYLTGALFLRSGVNLHIGKQVTLLAIPDIKHYPKIDSRIAGIEMSWPSAIINVLDQKNVAISGEGKLECQGKIYWEKYWTMRKEYEAKGLRWIVDYDCERVRGILVSRSSDVTIKDLNIFQAGFWTVQLLYSDYCTVDGLTIRNNIVGKGPSTDGIDVDSSTHVLVQNSDIDCNDDNICLKSGRDWDGLRVNRPTEYVVIRNCISRQGAGLVTCGSETSGGISNIVGYNLKSEGTTAAIRLKSAMNRGGYIRDIYFSDIEAENVVNVVSVELNWNPSYSYSVLPDDYKSKELPPHWRTMLEKVSPKEKGYTQVNNIYLSNIRFRSCTGAFIRASGIGNQLPLRNFWLKDIEGDARTGGSIRNMKQLNILDVTISTADGSRVDLAQNADVKGEIQYKPYQKEQGFFDRSINKRKDGVEVLACDYPEFAFLFPEMAGNFKLGLSNGKKSYWIDREHTKSVRQQNNGWLYEVEMNAPEKNNAPLKLLIEVLPLKESGGIALAVEGKKLPDGTNLYWAFGGASGKKEVNDWRLLASSCVNNVFSLEGNAFTVYYGESMALKVLQGLVPPTSLIRLSDAGRQFSPEEFFLSGKKTETPALASSFPLEEDEKYYFCFYRQNNQADYNYYMLPSLFK